MRSEILSIPEVALADLGDFLGTGAPPPPSSSRALNQWRMEDDDAPILRYLYSSHRPLRHLEFGTWMGFGACLCLESCAATVWTLNLPNGETRPDGTWAYGQRVSPSTPVPAGGVIVNFGVDEEGPRNWLRTDAGGSIGHLYRDKGLGHRVAQVYCDSREWDVSAYPNDFFDSVLIDGGHIPEVVASDTEKALKVLRPGGMILWHDFCPREGIAENFDSVKGVTEGVARVLPLLTATLTRMAWINPSWLLVGIKA